MRGAGIGERGGERGTTMIEVVVMGCVMSLMLVMITESFASLSRSRVEQKQSANVGQLGAKIATAIERDIAYASRVFTHCAEDLAYLAAMRPGRELAETARHRLPTLVSKGLFEPDPSGSPETGDVIFLGTVRERVGVEVESGGATQTFQAQTYMFVVYTTTDLPSGAIEMRRWVSSPLVAYWDLMDIGDPALRADVVSAMYDAGLRYAWDPRAPRPQGLFELQQAGSLTQLPEERTVEGEEDPQITGLLAPRGAKIAANGALPGMPVPELAVPRGAFPGGFEVKVDGGRSGKLVLFRIVLQSAAARTQTVCGESRRIVDTDG